MLKIARHYNLAHKDINVAYQVVVEIKTVVMICEMRMLHGTKKKFSIRIIHLKKAVE